MRSVRILGGLSLIVAVICAAVTTAAADPVVRASAVISGCTDPAISGFALLLERPSDEGVKLVDVTVVVTGLPDGKHAVHIHETGACSPCSGANGHFDPGPASNSSPDGNHPFHSGDLINLEVHGGVGALHTETSRVTLSPGPLSLFDADGSAVIIHVNPDTYCPSGPVAGCAGGARAACGVITTD
ncbi:MAG TPA: superoxide dismutase family protein [Thermoanaerobaculia bacterium]|jgi:Cu-Zn family superoxide dismutase|nr:superoxide dismutase family protein [Thermoanaerobaculia bacterium]